MRILLWHGYLLEGTGSNIYTQHVARAWGRLGHDVRVVCAWPTEKEETSYRGAAFGPVVHEAVGDGLLVDLRSTMYAAFWRPDVPRVASVRVLHSSGGQLKVVSHFNKATKGRIVRALLESGANPRTASALAEVLRDLGWKVEEIANARGTQLDVIVTEV